MGEAKNPGPSTASEGSPESLGEAGGGGVARRCQTNMLAHFGGDWTDVMRGEIRAKAIVSAAVSAGKHLLERGRQAVPTNNPGVTYDLDLVDMAREVRVEPPEVGAKLTVANTAKEMSLAAEPARPYGEGMEGGYWRNTVSRQGETEPVHHATHRGGAWSGVARRRGGEDRRQKRAGHRGGARRCRYDKRKAKMMELDATSSTSVYFSNVTYWSDHAQEYLYGSVRADIMLIAETHMRRCEVEAMRNQAKRQGYECTVAPAEQSENSERGTHGGLLALAKLGRRSSPLSRCEGTDGAILDSSSLVGREIWVDAVPVIFLGGCLETGTVLSGCNLAVLQEVEEITRTGKRLFIMAADFNASPDDWCRDRGGWLHRNDASIITPDNSPITCRGGLAEEGGSLIDYIVASNKVLPLIERVWADLEAPWGPHYGLRVKLKGRADLVMVDRLVRNNVLDRGRAGHDTGAKEEEVAGDEVSEIPASSGPLSGSGRRSTRTGKVAPSGRGFDERDVDDAMWEQEFAAAAAEARVGGALQGKVAIAIDDYAKQTGIYDEAERLGDNLTTWARAMQRCVRRATGGGAVEAAERGRPWCGTPEIRRVPLLEGRPKRRFIDGAGGGAAHTRIWKTLARRLKEVECWSRRDKSKCTALGATMAFIEKVLNGGDGFVDDAMQHIDEENRWTLLGELNLALRAATEGEEFDAADGMALLDRLAAAATRRSNTLAAEGFKRWIKKSLRDGGKEAHRWANAPNALPALRLIMRNTSNDEFITDPVQVADAHRRPWASEWETGDPELWRKELAAMESVRRKCMDSSNLLADAVDLAPAAIRRACRSFAANTAIGADDLDFKIVAKMPNKSLTLLGLLIKELYLKLALPRQALFNVLILLGKRAAGREPSRSWPAFTGWRCAWLAE